MLLSHKNNIFHKQRSFRGEKLKYIHNENGTQRNFVEQTTSLCIIYIIKYIPIYNYTLLNCLVFLLFIGEIPTMPTIFKAFTASPENPTKFKKPEVFSHFCLYLTAVLAWLT